jgi:hypothetical protein
MRFVDRLRTLLWALATRVAILFVGCSLLIIAIGINMNAGREILAGLVSPDTAMDIVNSVARLVLPAAGLWLVYRGLR